MTRRSLTGRPPGDRLIRFPLPSTLTVAHRGAHGDGLAENSLAALVRAIELSAAAVELDVAGGPGGRFGVAHDDRRDEVTAPELGPYLEVLRSSPQVLLVLDWKGGGEEAVLARTMAAAGLAGRTVVTTSDGGALLRFREAEPELTLGLTLPGEHRPDTGAAAAALATAAGATAISLDASWVSVRRVQAIRRAGLGLFLWTASSLNGYRRLLWYRPDGIMTDTLDGLAGEGLRPLPPAWHRRLGRA